MGQHGSESTGRVFGWGRIKRQLVDASADLQKLITNFDLLREKTLSFDATNGSLNKELQQASGNLIKRESEIEQLNATVRDMNSKITNTSADLSTAKENIKGKEEKIMDLFLEIAGLKKDLSNVQADLTEAKDQNTILIKDEEFRKREHSNAMASLQRIQDQIQADRNSELTTRNAKEIERIRDLKMTWSKHQEHAKETIKSICQRYTIQYVEKVPFKGDPDNTLMICDEFVVLDAKSPGSDDFSNFPTYLKNEAEKAKKYAKQEAVKSDIFFVVPTNALDYIDSFVYRHGEHNVYIISIDALEPIILGLKKIEEYEFAEQLSPDDRENICRVLGRFAHLSKRRIQVDSFFAKQFIELAYKCEVDLPKDILDSVIEFEKSEKINPPQERKAKAIQIGELEREAKQVRHEAEGRGIDIENANIASQLNELPLYKKSENS